jgi:hypothetical protein
MATVSERARHRATDSKLRAIFRITANGVPYYRVHNLTNHHVYLVKRTATGTWYCHCEAAKANTRCKHKQRVLDREERRTKREALAELRRETMLASREG